MRVYDERPLKLKHERVKLHLYSSIFIKQATTTNLFMSLPNMCWVLRGNNHTVLYHVSMSKLFTTKTC